jgi:hypothetical protein
MNTKNIFLFMLLALTAPSTWAQTWSCDVSLLLTSGETLFSGKKKLKVVLSLDGSDPVAELHFRNRIVTGITIERDNKAIVRGRFKKERGFSSYDTWSIKKKDGEINLALKRSKILTFRNKKVGAVANGACKPI